MSVQSERRFNKILIKGIRKFFSTYAIMFAILTLVIILSIASDAFLTMNNIVNILRQVSMVAIMAVGSYFVMVGGGIDASLGAIVGFTSIIFASVIVKMGLPYGWAIVLALLSGGIAGLANGVAVSMFSIPPLIATIGVRMVLVGITYILCGGYTVSGLPDGVLFIGRGYVGALSWLPVPVFIMVIVAVVADFISQKTKFGRYVYTVGGNAEAAYLSGVKHKLIHMSTYIIAGVLAALAGVILTGRLAAGKAGAGDGWEFDAIIGCVIGGVSTTGGRGRVLGAILGAIMIGILNNGMTLLDINSFYQQVVSGLVLIIAIGIDIYSVRRKGKVSKKKKVLGKV